MLDRRLHLKIDEYLIEHNIVDRRVEREQTFM